MIHTENTDSHGLSHLQKLFLDHIKIANESLRMDSQRFLGSRCPNDGIKLFNQSLYDVYALICFLLHTLAVYGRKC
jgi:hypothetical protein